MVREGYSGIRGDSPRNKGHIKLIFISNAKSELRQARLRNAELAREVPGLKSKIHELESKIQELEELLIQKVVKKIN